MERVLNSSQQRMKDVAEKQRKQKAKAKKAGYDSYKDMVNSRRWHATRIMAVICVVGYVFYDFILKWF